MGNAADPQGLFRGGRFHHYRRRAAGEETMISRRSLILGFGSIPFPVRRLRAQTMKARRIGLLSAGAPLTDTNPLVIGLSAGFTKRGYVVGGSLLFERRNAQGHVDQLPQLVDELVKTEAELIITLSYAAARIAKERAPVPLVVLTGADPVALGLINSLARPGGNITGIGEVAAELSAKRLEVLKETFPGLHKVAMLWNANDLGMTLRYNAANAAARTLGLEVEPLGVREPDDFAAAFSAMARDRPDAILMVTDALTSLNRKRVFEFAAEQRLPAIYEYHDLVRDGGLMSYGPDMAEVYDRAAELADRILKGAKVADLPFELPTRFRLAINMNTAAALGLTIPQSILLRADEVIE